GDTRITAGTLALANASALGASTLDMNTSDAGSLSFGTLTAASIGGLKGTRNVSLQNTTPAAVALTVGGNGQSTTYSGVLSSSGSLTKTGAGTLTLSGANSFSGTTTIGQGTLALSGSGALASSTIDVQFGTTFDVSGVSFTLGSGKTIKGNGTIVGNVTDSSGSTITPGASVGLLTVSGNLNLAGGDTLQYEFATGTNDQIVVTGDLTPSGTTTINLATLPSGGLVNGNYDLIKVSGNLNGSAANFTVTGAPSPSRQTFAIVYDTASSPKKVQLQVSGSAGTLTWSPTNSVWDITTTYNWTNAASVSADIYFDGDNVNFTDLGSATSPTLNTTVNPSTVTFDSANDYTLTGTGKITGGGPLTKSGAGALTLGTTNDYTGITTLTGGTVTVTNLANGGSASAIGAAASASANLVLNGSTLQYAGATASINRGATLGASGGTLAVAEGANTLTVSGTIAGVSGGALAKNGPGTLTLGGANTYDGNTTINAGTLTVSGGSAIPDTSAVTLANTASAALSLSSSETIASLAGGGASGGNVALGANTLTEGNSSSTAFNGILSGTGALVKNGSGTLTLGGSANAINTLTLNAGAVDLNTDLALAGATLLNGSGGTINATGGGKILLNVAAGDIGCANGGTLTINSVIANGTQSSVDFWNTSSGTGIVVLTADNTFDSTLNLQSGVISVANVRNSGVAGNLGKNGTIHIGAATSASTLKYTGTGETSDKVIDLAGTTGGATLDQSGTGNLKFTANLTAATAGAKTLTLQGSTAGTGELAGNIVDSSGGGTSVTKLGTGTWTLSGANNTYTNGTRVNQGTLIVSGTIVHSGASDFLSLNNVGA
ncbi:MAG: hypothetical protein EPO07_03785, partial [Verrucomicrobia bacterium]